MSSRRRRGHRNWLSGPRTGRRGTRPPPFYLRRQNTRRKGRTPGVPRSYMNSLNKELFDAHTGAPREGHLYEQGHLPGPCLGRVPPSPLRLLQHPAGRDDSRMKGAQGQRTTPIPRRHRHFGSQVKRGTSFTTLLLEVPRDPLSPKGPRRTAIPLSPETTAPLLLSKQRLDHSLVDNEDGVESLLRTAAGPT